MFTRSSIRAVATLTCALWFVSVCCAQQNEGQKPAAEDQDAEIIKVDTNLVTVPVVVNNRQGVYVPDMKKEEFVLEEDGTRQDIVFFATVTAPFHVVLMLDTSASTEEKLADIRRAADAFLDQLQTGDRVKVIAFDDEVRDTGDFTDDRNILRRSIASIRAGHGTRLYDAVQRSFQSLQPTRGRKAIVLFTDGVDFHSAEWRYRDNMRALEESGIIVYPIRYDTREETERLARRQAQGGAQGTDLLGAILGPGVGRGDNGGDNGQTTPTTFPGDESSPLPRRSGNGGGTNGGPGGVTIGGLPMPSIVVPRTGTRDGRDGRGGIGDDRRTDDPFPDASDSGRRRRRDDSSWPSSSSGASDDSISHMLDLLYKTGDAYLNDLALKSGGKLTRADTLAALPAAFKNIADELRTQYALGYYPAASARDGRYHKIRVTAERKNTTVRARPGYQATRKN